MAVKVFAFNQGLNLTSDRSMLAPGELQLATGAYYKSGDTARAWKLAGRSLFGTLASGARIWTLALCKFDTAANDKLVVLASDGSLHTAPLTTASSGSLTTLTTGINTSGSILAWTHFDDVWFFGNGIGPNYAYESDGTFRLMGMVKNEEQLVGTVNAEGTLTERATSAVAAKWTGEDRLLSANHTENNYAWAATADNSTDFLGMVLDGFASDTAATGRYLLVQMNAGDRSPKDPFQILNLGTELYNAVFKIEVDEGSGYVQKYKTTIKKGITTGYLNVPITDGVDLANVVVRISLQENTGIFQNDVTVRVFDVQITDTGNTSDFTPDIGFSYAYAEFDSTRQLEATYTATGILFGPSDTGNSVTLDLPAAVNPLADERIIYRTHDGGNVPGDLRELKRVDIAQTTYFDPYEGGKLAIGSGKTPPQLKVQITDDLAQFYRASTPPPASSVMVEYQNFVVALSDKDPRSLYYSLPAFPEYWPELYVITDFPLQEHDQLVSLAVTGDLLVVGAKEALIIINGLPEVEAQAYSSAYMTALKGAPGCVGPLAMTAYSLGGEPRVAWISKFGIYETNGHQVWELTHDIDFNSMASADLSRASMHWDIDDQLLYVCYDSNDDTYNDRFLTLHMSPEHRKDKRGAPKITGPHYGNLTNIVSGVVPSDNEYHMYSADSAATGQVLNEKTGGVDVTNAYNTLSELPYSVKTARLYGPQLDEWAVDFPTVRHLNWGATPVAITWTVGRDEPNESDAVVNTITMSAQKATKFVVARSGEWHEIQIDHDGDTVTGAILGIQAGTTDMTETGDTQDS